MRSEEIIIQRGSMKFLITVLFFLSSLNSYALIPPVEEACKSTDITPELANDVQDILRRENCGELPVGGVRVSSYDQSLHGLSGDYGLKRVSRKHYVARISIAFNDGGGPGSGQRMLEKSQECIAEANPHMKGPNGELLEIQLLTHDQNKNLPEEERSRDVTITIDKPGEGGHSYNFLSGFSCTDIIHEYLHHLGLCDEYAVNGTATSGNYDFSCRVVVRSPAYLMNNKDAAWQRTFHRDPKDPPAREQSLLAPNHFYKILEMNCPGRSAGYQLCGSFAYRGGDCSNIPQECRDPEFYLGPLPQRN